MKVKLQLVVVTAFFATACAADQRIINSATKPTPSNSAAAESTPSPNTVEQDVETMRVADFNFIYVFRRKDGAVLDARDKALAAAITPPEVNRRKISDGGKAIVLGSNFRLPPDVMEQMTDHFAFQDFSKSESELSGNSSVNANK